jgi:hypothetical protein
LSEKDEKNVEKANEAFDLANLSTIIVMLVFADFMAKILDEMKVVHFFSYLLAVDMVFPSIAQKFFGRLLK